MLRERIKGESKGSLSLPHILSKVIETLVKDNSRSASECGRRGRDERAERRVRKEREDRRTMRAEDEEEEHLELVSFCF